MLIPGLLIAVAFVAVQDTPTITKPPKKGDIVVVRGCLTGGVIEAGELSSKDGDYKHLVDYDYRLTGKKDLIRELKQEHGGHVEAVTGILKTDLPTERKGMSGRIGNTGIGVGLGNQPGRPQRPLPVLEVTGFEHTGIRCR